MKNIVLLISSFLCFSCFSQTLVSPDSSFNEDGRVAIEVGISSSGESGMGSRVLKFLPEGKMLIATTAKINEFNANRNYWIGRLDENGLIDESFGDAGRTIIFSGNDGVGNALVSVETDSEGGILILGERKDPFTVIEEAVVKRLLPDGSVDNSFGESGETVLRLSPIGSLTRARDLEVLSNGKILVLMDTRYSSTSPVGLGTEYCVARLNPDGSIDSSFAENGLSFIVDASLNDLAAKMAIQENGKIVLAGTVTISGVSKYRFIRLNENGSVDEEFGTNGSLIVERGNESAVVLNDLIIDSNGAILATGNASQMLTIVRLNSNGLLDETFNNLGYVNIPALDIGNKLLLTSDGFIFAIGREFNQVMLAKIDNTGNLLSDFGSQGTTSLGSVNPSSTDLTAAFSNDDKLFIAGKWTNENLDYYSIVKVKFSESGEPTGVNNLSNRNSLFPNPCMDYIRVKDFKKGDEYFVFNMNGALEAAGKFDVTGTISTNNLSAGLYVLRCPKSGFSARFSLIKQ